MSVSLLDVSAGAMPGAPTGAAVGLTWVPYLGAGLALVVVAMVVRLRSRTRRDVGRSEFLLFRGVILLLVGVLVALLADAAAEGDGLTAADRPVWSWFIGHRTAVLNTAARIVTDAGSTGVMGVLAVLAAGWLVTRPGRRSEAILVAAVAVGAALLVVVSKPIVGRVRPPVEYRLVDETNQSFPSGHALASVAILAVLAVVFLPGVRSALWRRIGYVALALWAVAIGASRLYLGVHWSTDVVGGWLTGAGWLLFCLTAFQVWTRYPNSFRRPSPMSMVGQDVTPGVGKV